MKHRLDIDDNLTMDVLKQQVADGARFVVFPYCISLIFAITLSRLSPAILIKDEAALAKHKAKYKRLSVLFGWWCFPWGPSRTIQCLKICNAGGTDVTDDVMLNITEEDLAKKEVQVKRTTMLFVKPKDLERKALLRVVDKRLDASLQINRMVVGLFINTGNSEPYHVIGIDTKRDFDEVAELVKKALYKEFYNNAYFAFLDLNNKTDVVNNDIDTTRILLEQGEMMIGQ